MLKLLDAQMITRLVQNPEKLASAHRVLVGVRSTLAWQPSKRFFTFLLGEGARTNQLINEDLLDQGWYYGRMDWFGFQVIMTIHFFWGAWNQPKFGFWSIDISPISPDLREVNINWTGENCGKLVNPCKPPIWWWRNTVRHVRDTWGLVLIFDTRCFSLVTLHPQWDDDPIISACLYINCHFGIFPRDKAEPLIFFPPTAKLCWVFSPD